MTITMVTGQGAIAFPGLKEIFSISTMPALSARNQGIQHYVIKMHVTDIFRAQWKVRQWIMLQAF